jgi:hypothetical protein
MAYEGEFEDFWKLYPLKRDRLAALKAYQKARREGATQGQFIAGIHDYRKHKPQWQAWKHCATWINKGGYLDEWNEAPTMVESLDVDWFEECQRLHQRACNGRSGHALKMMIDANRPTV